MVLRACVVSAVSGALCACLSVPVCPPGIVGTATAVSVEPLVWRAVEPSRGGSGGRNIPLKMNSVRPGAVSACPERRGRRKVV